MEKTVVILRGLPGSGKSHYVDHFHVSWIRNCGRDEKIVPVICSADDFFMVDGEYRFDPSAIGLAHAECFRKFVDAVNNKAVRSVIVDNTNITQAEFSPYVTYGLAYGCDVKLVTMWCPLETAMSRQTHDVPSFVMLRMYADLLRESVPPWYKHEVICVTVA